MYTLPKAREVASRQSVLAGEERFVLRGPGAIPPSLYDVCTPEELETFHLGYRDADLLDCYVNGESQF